MNDADSSSLSLMATELAGLSLALQRDFLLRLNHNLDKAGVSFSQFFLLAHLDSTEHLTMSRIARQMGHTTAAATGLVDRLEGLGYVLRAHSKEDRRKVFCTITPKGSALVEGVKAGLAGQISDILAELTPGEREIWLSVYRKLAVSYEHQTPLPTAGRKTGA